MLNGIQPSRGSLFIFWVEGEGHGHILHIDLIDRLVLDNPIQQLRVALRQEGFLHEGLVLCYGYIIGIMV